MAQTTLKKIEELDFYGDIRRAVAVNAVGVSKLIKHVKFLAEDNEIDDNYRIILQGVLNKGLKSNDKGKEKDNNGKGNVLEESRPKRFESSIRQRGNKDKINVLELEESRPPRVESSVRQRGDNDKCNVLEKSRPQRPETRCKRKERDETVYYNAEDKDLDYMRFLKCSKEWNAKEKDPAFEPFLKEWKVHSKSGVLKYKPLVSADEESSQEPRTTNRATIQKIQSSSLKSSVAKLKYCNCGHKGKAVTTDKAYGMNGDNGEKGRELDCVARPRVEFAAHLPRVHKMHNSNAEQPSVKKNSDVIQLRRPMGRESRNEAMMTEKNSPNNIAPLPENHHILQDVKREDDHTVRKRNSCNVTNKKNLGVNNNIEKNVRQTKAASQGLGHSDRMPNGPNQHKHDLPSASVNKVSRLNVLKKQDLGKLTRETRPKVRLSNEMSDAENQHMEDPQNTKNLTVRISRNEAGMAECSSAAQYRKPRKNAGKADVPECSRAAQYKNSKATKSAIGNQKVGETVVEVDHRNKTTSDIEILDSTALFSEGITTPFVPSRKIHYNEKPGSSRACKDTEFRRQLFEILRRPYDKEEYGRLRKAVESGLYFQYHPDLKKKLAKWRYKPGKLLNILRGFFFWLQNLTQEGSFKPWKDGKCLVVEPPRL